MKKILTCFIVTVFCYATAPAQYVEVPDPRFNSFLQFYYPSCFNAEGKLDTTCAEILTEDSLNLVSAGMYDIEAVQYFKNLRYLNCSYGMIGKIPPLPATLRYFNMSHIQTLPPQQIRLQLPDSLRYFNCEMCNAHINLRSLPPFLDSLISYNGMIDSALPALPATLKYLSCGANKFTTLPDLPNGLRYLDCQAMWPLPMSSLPRLPDSLKVLLCGDNMITTLPALPEGLLQLNCKGNGLAALPVLPASLLSLDFGNGHILSGNAYPTRNSIAVIPPLPNTLQELAFSSMPECHLPVQLPDSLKMLVCDNDSITALPALPAGLNTLNCDNNLLTVLPALPHLETLSCNSNSLSQWPAIPGKPAEISARLNNITCLPAFSNNYSGTLADRLTIKIDAEKINCFPNLPAGVFIERYNANGTRVYGSALCNPLNNQHHCQAFPVMSGYVFYDNNLNGVQDAGEMARPGIKISLADDLYTFTDSRGYYEIGSGGTGDYTITASGSPVYYNLLPAAYAYSFTSNDTIVSNNFFLQANATIDSLNIHLTGSAKARAGNAFYYTVHFENAGTTTQQSILQMNYDNTRLDFIEAYETADYTAVPVTNNGSSLSVDLGNFSPAQQQTIEFAFRVKTTVTIGNVLQGEAIINAESHTYSDTTSTLVSGPFDPNDKQATRQLSPSQVANGDCIHYTIRFQNTGTDTAFNVVLSDTLSSDLLANTLQIITASHNCKTTVKNNVVFFEFLHIMLPDSNMNERKSHGFVSFRIQPRSAVATNTTIYNSAAIYFDYNAPVITNAAATLIKDPVVLPLKLVSFSAVPQNDNSTRLRWITANEINTKQFVIERSMDENHFTPVANIEAKGGISNNYTIVVADANRDIVWYRLKMTDTDGQFTYSYIIKVERRKNTPGFSILNNPAKDALLINNSDKSLLYTKAAIVNIQGSIVKTFSIKEGNQSVNIEDLPAGTYYLRTINRSSMFVIMSRN